MEVIASMPPILKVLLSAFVAGFFLYQGFGLVGLLASANSSYEDERSEFTEGLIFAALFNGAALYILVLWKGWSFFTLFVMLLMDWWFLIIGMSLVLDFVWKRIVGRKLKSHEDSMLFKLSFLIYILGVGLGMFLIF